MLCDLLFLTHLIFLAANTQTSKYILAITNQNWARKSQLWFVLIFHHSNKLSFVLKIAQIH